MLNPQRSGTAAAEIPPFAMPIRTTPGQVVPRCDPFVTSLPTA